MKEAVSSLHLPPTSSPKTISLQRRLRSSSGYVCSFLRRASRRAVPAKVPPCCLGTPSRVSGETTVVSTASWFPPRSGNPFAITSILLSSWRSMCSKLRSTKRVFVVTRAPASLHMRAAARSKGAPRAHKSPDCAQAARWSPRESEVRRRRQKRADKGSGRRRRLKRSRRKRWLG